MSGARILVVAVCCTIGLTLVIAALLPGPPPPPIHPNRNRTPVARLPTLVPTPTPLSFLPVGTPAPVIWPFERQPCQGPLRDQHCPTHSADPGRGQ